MRKGQLLEAILEQKEAVHKGGWNVATSQRPHVVTSQRRDVGSTNIKVATSRRQCEFCLFIIKSKKGCRF